MKRPGYREAIKWLAANDDNDWLDDEYSRHLGEPPSPSVAAALVADLFRVDADRLVADLRRALRRIDPA